MNEAMEGTAKPRSRGITGLGILAGTGAVLGLLSGLWFLTAKLAVAWFVLPGSLVLLLVSGAELAFAYGAWRLTAWSLRPWQRLLGLAVAIALIVVGAYVIYVIPIREFPRLEH